MAKFLSKKGIENWEEVNIKNIEEFIQWQIETWNKKKNLLSYKCENLKIDIRYILEACDVPVTTLIKQKIRNKIFSVASPIIEQNPTADNRAPVFGLKTVKQVLEKLWKGDDTDKATAAILAITFTTGARIVDTTKIRRSRIKLVKNKTGYYLKIAMKTSKSNPIGRNPEQLTYKLGKNNIIKMDLFLAKWLATSQDKKDLVFPFAPKTIINRSRAVCQKMGINPPITGHSGRNSVVKALYDAKVDHDSKIIKMRWVPNSKMPIHYRALLLEESTAGATFQLFQNKFNVME